MKSVVALWLACLSEAGSLCCVRTDADRAYALRRLEKEGESFLTITLPAFEKALMRCLEIGRMDSSLFPSFKKGRGGLPAFLSGFLESIFSSGELLPPSRERAEVLRCVRQICLLVSKQKLPSSDRRTRAAVRQYLDVDSELEEPKDLESFGRAADRIFGPFLGEVEARLFAGDWLPRHSSGAVADRLSYNERFGFDTWTARLQEVLPWWSDMDLSWNDPVWSHVKVLAPEDEPPVRVVTVPKTQKTPRVIAMEPAHNMFVQQGILKIMEKLLHDPRFKRVSRGISWLDQEPNRELARIGSIDGSLATLDLSEASDRVHASLVWTLLRRTPFLRRAVFAARSERAQTSEGLITLKKFASMGSALCFPFEAMVFYTLAEMGVRDSGAPAVAVSKDLPSYRVYGDDIIVPVAAAHSVSRTLEAYGLRVNRSKSFSEGLFRESCGSDWWGGFPLTVVKLREPLPETSRQYPLIRSCVDFHNRLFEAGWFGTAEYVSSLIGRLVPRLYGPVGCPRSVLWSYKDPDLKWDSNLQIPLIRAYRFRERKPSDPLSDYGALRKSWQPHGDEPRDATHLDRDGRSRCVGMNIGWTPLA